MPELPEVETIRQNLRRGGENFPSLLGMVVRRAGLYWDRSLATPSPDEFKIRIAGQSVREIGRRGKFLVFSLSGPEGPGDFLLIHLRMSGDLWLEPDGAPIGAHYRLSLHFDQPWRLAFNDPRKFGRIWLVRDPAEVLGGLGPEPLEAEFTPSVLYQRLQSTRRQLKPLLLDQTFVAGLGNIYTDEALNLAHLHPLQNSQELDREDAGRLCRAIRSVLEEGIRRNGASIDWVYRGGDFQNYFRVYGRKDQPCPDCGTALQRIVVGQRGTYFCPFCQVKKGRNAI